MITFLYALSAARYVLRAATGNLKPGDRESGWFVFALMLLDKKICDRKPEWVSSHRMICMRGSEGGEREGGVAFLRPDTDWKQLCLGRVHLPCSDRKNAAGSWMLISPHQALPPGSRGDLRGPSGSSGSSLAAPEERFSTVRSGGSHEESD